MTRPPVPELSARKGSAEVRRLLVPAAIACLALSACGGAGTSDPTAAPVSGGQATSAGTAAPAPAPSAPSPAPAPSGPPAASLMPTVNTALIPQGSPGVGIPMVVRTGAALGLPPGGDQVGNMRTNCEFSHMNFDDPIVFPGIRNATHLHAFFGNTRVDAGTTSQSLATTGNSTCRGGTLNRSAYWVPAIIDTRAGRPLTPGTPVSDNVPEHGFYYKTKYSRIPFSAYRAPPQGLRMIAGDSKATSPQSADIVGFSCNEGPNSPGIPSCPVGGYVTMHVTFPNCWDGRNLDSPDHKSHMAYAVGDGGGVCPSTHPVPIPNIQYNIHWAVRAGDDTRFWRLSSDNYAGGPGGYSLHGDWWDGWDTPTMETQVRNCLNAAPRECGNGMLGDGRELSYAWPLLAPRQ